MRFPARSIPWAVLSALLALSLASPSTAQRSRKKDAPPKPVRVAWFDGDLATAQLTARRRNVPLAVFCVLDGEEASKRFGEQLLDNRVLAAACVDTVAVVVNNGLHPTEEVKVKGADGETQRVSMCSAYHTTSCEVHRRNWDKVYQEYVAGPKDGHWELPEVIIVQPDGKIFERIYHAQPPGDSEIVSHIQRAARTLGEGLTEAQLAEMLRIAGEARSFAKASAWAQAWRAWSAACAVTEAGPLGEEAKAGRDVAAEALTKQIAAAEAALAGPGLDAAYRELTAIQAALKGSSRSKEVGAALKRASRKDGVGERIAALKLEIEAEALVAEIARAEADGKKSVMRKGLRKLYSKKYGTTAAAQAARARWGEDRDPLARSARVLSPAISE